MMKNKIKSIPNILIVVVRAVIFFLATARFNFFTQSDDFLKWTSPDETANYFFAKRFSTGQGLAFFDDASLVSNNMVAPRSFRVDSGWLKPVSFLGIILIYGSLGSIFGSGIIPFLTPIFAALGIIIFYYLIKKLFSERVALVSSFLLASFPVYIYYTVRSMFHNVLFVVLLLAGVYLLISACSQLFKKQSFLSWKISGTRFWSFLLAFLGGALFGLMTITRTSELIWFLPAAFIAWLFYVKRLGLAKLLLALSGFIFALLPSAYFNQILYSAPIYGGYNEMNRSLDDLSQASSGIVKKIFTGEGELLTYFESIYHNVFYFGFKPQQSLEMAWHYIVEMFPYLAIAFVLGTLILAIVNIKRPQKKYLVYFLVFLTVSTILIFYYGSWKFNDNPDPTRFTIGNSYTRYWLPIYLMMIPLASLAIVYLSRFLVFSFKEPTSKLKRIIMNGWQAIFVLCFCILGLDFVLFGSEEGLANLYHTNLAEKKVVQEVFALTEPEAVIITRYYDKFLFPDRRVIMGTLPDVDILKASAKLSPFYPVYYYNFYLQEKDVNYLNEKKLAEYNLELKLLKRISHDFGLYSLTAVSPLIEKTNLPTE